MTGRKFPSRNLSSHFTANDPGDTSLIAFLLSVELINFCLLMGKIVIYINRYLMLSHSDISWTNAKP